MGRRVWIALVLVCAVACGGDDGPSAPDQTRFGTADRPTDLRVPVSYDHATPTPLLLVLHGYSASGAAQLAYSRLDGVDALILAPDGTEDAEGNLFWNATEACCDFFGTGVDDVGYLGDLLDEVRGVYNVDPDRIYLWGHSNGGFMSYRMACERAGDIAAIINLAGQSFLSRQDCAPTEPVSVLHVHGDADDEIEFGGGNNCVGFECLYPSVDETLSHWSSYDGCGETRTAGGDIDLDSSIDGAETVVETVADCPAGIDIELWRIQAGSHIPTFRPTVGQQFWTWLSDHAKP